MRPRSEACSKNMISTSSPRSLASSFGAGDFLARADVLEWRRVGRPRVSDVFAARLNCRETLLLISSTAFLCAEQIVCFSLKWKWRKAPWALRHCFLILCSGYQVEGGKWDT